MSYIACSPVRSACLTILYGTLWMLSPDLRAQQRPGTTPREGEVESQEITIEKNRRIELPAANRVFQKIPAPKQTTEARKLTYEFIERPLVVGEARLSPVARPVELGTAEDQPLFNNFVKVGAGNFGSFYGEAFGSGKVQDNVVVDGSFRHLSSSIGPVDGKNSAQSNSRLRLNGSYLTSQMKLTAQLGYERDGYFFYGYRPGETIDRESIRQRLNTSQVRLGIENVDPTNNIDYSLKTGVSSLRDRFNAAEVDWATNFNGSVGITEKLVALVAADAYVTQRTDALVDNRNLFRVKPTFKFSNSFLTITAGVNAVNETDKRLNSNNTRAFPVLDIDVVPAGSIHFYGGVNGDIQRNTLQSLLRENRWLSPNVVLANTEKLLDIYGGSKGNLGGGFSYEGKVSYARYRNFATFNNAWTDTTRFFVLYDGGVSNVLTVSGQLGYLYKDLFRSGLKVEVYDYSLSRLREAWHRPRTVATWSNSLIVNKKLFVTTDLYHYGGLKGANFISGEVVSLPAIWDLNLKIDYFLGKQVSAFVSINNILGRNYQRYLYYPQQGLNFLGGLSYSF